MISTNVDIGQLIIAALIGIVGWFINRSVSAIDKRLDRHDDELRDLFHKVDRFYIAAKKHYDNV